MKKAKFYFNDGTVKEWACDDVETSGTHVVVRKLQAKSEIIYTSTETYDVIAVVSMANLLWWEPL